MVAAKAGLEFMKQNNIEEETVRKSKIVENFLEKEILPIVLPNAMIRGIGLIWGIDVQDGVYAKKISKNIKNLDNLFYGKIINYFHPNFGNRVIFLDVPFL